jgi:hypothetical protein
VSEDGATWELTVGVGDGLRLSCRNQSQEPQRIWLLDNSWGWSMPAIDVLGAADGPLLARLVPAPRVWTKNVPRFEVVDPGSSLTMAIDRGDLVAADPDVQVADLPDQDLWVVARLASPVTPESTRLGVWSGEVSSAPTEVGRPRLWLAVTGS